MKGIAQVVFLIGLVVAKGENPNSNDPIWTHQRRFDAKHGPKFAAAGITKSELDRPVFPPTWTELIIPRSLLAPPLAPSFEKLQSLVDDVSKERNKEIHDEDDPDHTAQKMLPCLLRGGGCKSEEVRSYETKKSGDQASNKDLQKTQASIESAVSKLQKDLDRKTAEVVKEIERRAAEMRHEIAEEAEQLIEAVKYLVTMLSDSVTRADEMGQDFVREWFDEAKNRYVGSAVGDKAADAKKIEDDLKEQNYEKTHENMIQDLKESVVKTREKYGEPKSHGGLNLNQQLGLNDDDDDDELDDATTAPSREAGQKAPNKSSVSTEDEPEKAHFFSKDDLSAKETESGTETHDEARRVSSDNSYGFIEI